MSYALGSQFAGYFECSLGSHLECILETKKLDPLFMLFLSKTLSHKYVYNTFDDSVYLS